MITDSAHNKLSAKELEYLVIENDSGARVPSSRFSASVLLWVAVGWAMFQLWVASPLPFLVNFGIFNSTESRVIHLGFALFLAFLAYPARSSSPRMSIPFLDWLCAILGTCCALYMFISGLVFEESIEFRLGRPEPLDVVAACCGVLFLFEATRRALGYPLIIIATLLLSYTYFGYHEYVPDIIRHKGQSLSKMASHFWLTTEGVFGIALGVSCKFVFLFVLFGALLERAGAGAYFIKLAFSVVGHMRGGPAKAAVLASGLTGLVSGSSIANVVTTGTFTIPLMRKVGFSGRKAGAIEVASSVNGQIMPPVMGAAAFLMVDYVGLPYFDVVKHAFLPAVISYIALLYMVHLEAIKGNMALIPKTGAPSRLFTLLGYGIVVCSFVIVSMVVYYAISWMKPFFGESATWYFCTIIFGVYLVLLAYSSRYPDLVLEEKDEPMKRLPRTRKTLLSGLHFLLPIAVLVWFLMIEKKSPSSSVFYATMLMIFITLTQDVLKQLFRKRGGYSIALRRGFTHLIDGFVTGSRNMIGIAVATAAAGIIVGVVSLTGVGLILAEVVEAVAGNSFITILLLTALICLILGMGLPTTANYIVVAALMAGVVQALAEKNGMHIPLIAIHLFVFYFGIMADVTPPVGLASFAASAISGADPIKTGVYAFAYSLRTAILPFFFIYNHELIMIGIESVWHGLWVFIYASVAILIFSAATQGYLLTRSRWYESVLLLVTSFIIFSPGQMNNIIYPPTVAIEMNNERLLNAPLLSAGQLKVAGEGENEYGDVVQFVLFKEVGLNDNVNSVLADLGIGFFHVGNRLEINQVKFGSEAEKRSIDPFGHYVVTSVWVPQAQPNMRRMYIPAMILFSFVLVSQFYRRRRENAVERFEKRGGIDA